MLRTFAADSVASFRANVMARLHELKSESGLPEVFMPTAIVLVLSKEQGGDATADELARRFEFLGEESRNVIDFYFLGWKQSSSPPGIVFDLKAFNSARTILREKGLTEFQGNADLLLCDAHFNGKQASLLFDEAIYVDLSSAIRRGTLDTLGSFLQAVVHASEDVKRGGADRPATFRISDRLALAYARQSLLRYIIDKWAKAWGAPTLAEIAVRRTGPPLPLAYL